MPNWALIVGINEYNKRVTGQDPLKGAVDDAMDFALWTLDPAGGNVAPDRLYFWAHPWPDEIPEPLAAALGAAPEWASPFAENFKAPVARNRGPTAEEIFATAEAAGNEVSELRRADPGGEPHRMIVFLAGHGTRMNALNDPSKQTFYFAVDFRTMDGNLAKGLVPCESLKRSLRNERFDEVMLFLDCCRTDPLSSLVQAQPMTNPVGDDELPGWSVGHAAAARGRAFEVAGPPARGAFTKILMEGLRGWRHAGTNSINVRQLEAYVKRNIPKLIGQTQKPYFVCEPDDEPLVVVTGNPTIDLPNPPGPLVHLDKLEAGKSIELEDLTDQQIVWQGGPYAAGSPPVRLPRIPEGPYSLRVVNEPLREELFRHPVKEQVHVP